MSVEEAAEALELMPLGYTDAELDPEKAIKMEIISCQASSVLKIKHQGYYIDGSLGISQVIPHAMHCKQVLDRQNLLTNNNKAVAFMASLCGQALTDAETVYNEQRVAIQNVDQNIAADPQNNVHHCTFEQYILAYCHKWGDEDSRQHQLEHQTMANVLRPIIHFNPPEHGLEAANIVDSALATTAYAARTSLHSTMKMSPGASVFGRDMLLDIPIIADLHLLRARRQQIIDRNLERANRKRVSHDYNVGDQCLKLIYKPDKLEPRAEGPYNIERVHSNGTLTIRLSPLVTERLSLRKVKPHFN